MAYKSILDVKEILNEYCEDIQKGLEITTQDVAKDAVKALKSTSPKAKRNTRNKGRYAKGWSVNTKKGRGYINCTVWNRTDYQLTHLLEHSHLTRNGKTLTKAIPHIAPVEETYVKEYQNKVEKVIQNGGK